MSNDFTGDYDVVLGFSAPAVNRVLAAMHRGNRFPHSLSMRVDDSPESKRSAVSVVDVSGNAVIEPGLVARTVDLAATAPIGIHATDISFQNVDPVVNFRGSVAPDFSHLKGIAHLQLGPPTIELPADSSAKAVFHTRVLARYFPDPGATILPDFLRGEFVITMGATEVSSAGATLIDINLVGTDGNIHFNQFSPPQRLTTHQLTAINLALRNALITSFEPSNSPLPSGVLNMQVRPLADQDALAVLMNVPGGDFANGIVGTPDPESVQQSFLAEADHFALTVAANLIVQPFADAVAAALSAIPRPAIFPVDVAVGTYTISASVGDAEITILDGPIDDPFNLFGPVSGTGAILLRIPVKVTSSRHTSIPLPDLPDFTFAVSQAFTLTLAGGQVGLRRLGGAVITGVPTVVFNVNLLFNSFSVDLHLPDLVDRHVRPIFTQALDSADPQIQQTIGAALGAGNLQEFFRKMMNPPARPKQAPVEEVDPLLTYTTFEIHASGVTLHGELAVTPDWPPPVVEFDLNPQTATSANPEYSALKSWIPGGSVQDYVWSFNSRAAPPDSDTFVSTNAPGLSVIAGQTVCLSVEGVRISSSGPVVDERVSGAAVCKSTSLPNAAVGKFFDGNEQILPDFAMTRMTREGTLQVTGHTSPWLPLNSASAGAANLLVHFPTDKTLANLDFLPRALVESGRTDTACAIACVLAPGQIARAPATDGLIFADDLAGWERLVGVKSRPSTYLIGTSGEVVWHHDGELTAADLAPALKRHLTAGGIFRPRFLETLVRVGQRAPNFILEYSPGRETTLRKVSGRQCVLVFLKASSRPSLETLANLRDVYRPLGARAPLLLAIDGGADSGAAGVGASGEGPSVIVVSDQDYQISRAYGVEIWPTTVALDAQGIVTDLRYGLISKEQTKPYPPAARAAANEPVLIGLTRP
ncbi:MAG TPA: redoxin domain-containing protein [Vicinamibacterales bacterium]|nr:redoxin domain-containing protein [Vicinamibacterales bacterium]